MIDCSHATTVKLEQLEAVKGQTVYSPEHRTAESGELIAVVVSPLKNVHVSRSTASWCLRPPDLHHERFVLKA